ncbi:MAG TPA: type 1 fimbrial protein [Proteus sp.]|uniref:PapA family protein n=1 Tax=Proteus hauseri ATCC 700826 TaxID=1354271 RepID=A0AAJ3LUX3_PROHU|nr:fimbrial protein [Proteus hauseri]OAT49462.1 PapA family protein [Proteus hauseri ATCC 700826]QAV23430.1 type 1 fimbrial protein [Proteus hauseri]HCH51816.1 type 1 fimbrial protein [Proteus sp. (in: enterobacteria)]
MTFNKLSIVGAAVALSLASFGSMAENNGVINFVGSVVDSPCNIADESLNQTVKFGEISRVFLEQGNEREKAFTIKLEQCNFDKFKKDDQGAWLPVKTMKIQFDGRSYADTTNTLLATDRAKENNVGIAIDTYKFGEAADILSKIRNKQGTNVLEFTALAKAVDVTKDVKEGEFSAIADFRISYE